MEQMYVIDWPHLWRLNRQWRQWMEANSEFVTPNTIDTLRYLRIECNEAADVELRNRLSKHPRNNGRDNTVHEELADALMLGLTALPDPEKWIGALCDDIDVTDDIDVIMDNICDQANQAVILFGDGSHAWFLWTADLIVAISRYPGMLTGFELKKCWYRLAWKHASKAMDSYPEELKPWT